MWGVLLLELKEAYQIQFLFFLFFHFVLCVVVIENARYNNLSFIFKGLFQHAPEHWTPKIITEVSDPESSHLLGHI